MMVGALSHTSFSFVAGFLLFFKFNPLLFCAKAWCFHALLTWYLVQAATTAPRGETGLASAASSIWNGYEGARGRNPSGGVVPPVNGVELGAPVNVDAADLQEQMLGRSSFLPLCLNRRPGIHFC